MVEQKSEAPKKKSRVMIYSVILVLVFISLYAVTLNGYIQEGANNRAPYAFGDETTADRLDVSSKVLTIDPVKGEVVVRFDITPQGNLTETEGYSATKNLILYVNSANGQTERTFEAGKALNPFDVTISLDGAVNDYPFDNYDGLLVFSASAKGKEEGAEEETVPVAMQLTANVPGFSIDAAANKESTEDMPVVDLTVTRSMTVKTVAIAGMLIMWAIGIVVIVMTFSFVFGSRKAEAFAFYSGLLFGLFGLRNSLPGTPSIGAQSDFLSFFWVEAIVAIMMVLTIAVSLKRPQK
jgi:hypothetical protein